MFGQNNKPHDDQLIPDQAIESALADDTASAQSTEPQVVSTGQWQHPGTPLDAPAPTAPTTVTDQPATDTLAAPATPVSDELQEIKQHALAELAPLVDHLEQSPEEKFRTTMMMLQASDDQALVAVAYEAAQKIQDDKAKAQALLDVINEINYFTQKATAQE